MLNLLMHTGLLALTIFFSFYKLKIKNRYKWICMGELISGIVSVICSFSNEKYTIFILIGIIYISSTLFYINVFAFINEKLNLKLQYISPSFLGVFYGISTILIPIFFYLNQNWKQNLRFYFGIPAIIISIITFMHSLKMKKVRNVIIFYNK